MLKIKFYIKNLYEDKVNDIITIEQFKELIKNYNDDCERLKNQLNTINSQIDYYASKKTTEIDQTELLDKYKLLKKINRVIVEEFIDKIYVGKINKETNTRDIMIKWNFG